MLKIPLESTDPYHRLFSYPDDDPEMQEKYRRQLHQLGVEYLLAAGTVRLSGLPLLGCGYCGLVFAGGWRGHEVALKLRRRSCRQPDLEQEASLHRHANRLGIGPELYCNSADVLVMERLTGTVFGDWLEQLRPTDAPQLQKVLLSLIEQCFALDQVGIDHGALRCISEHVFVERVQPTIIDFSHSSAERHPNNVTSLISGLLWGTQLALPITKIIPLPQRDNLLSILRSYKQQPTIDNLNLLIDATGLRNNL